MALQIKIHGETPKSGKPLCLTCKHSTVVRGQNGEERIYCSKHPMFTETKGLVTFRVSECAAYHPSNMPWLQEMEDMAWIIEARKRGAKGFQPAPGEDLMEINIKPPDPDRAGDCPS